MFIQEPTKFPYLLNWGKNNSPDGKVQEQRQGDQLHDSIKRTGIRKTQVLLQTLKKLADETC